MQFPTITISALTVLLSLAALSEAGASCKGVYRPFRNSFVVEADEVPSISDICNGFYDNLKPGCALTGGKCGGTNHKLHWDFNIPTTCGDRQVQDAWWAATRNKYGSIVCKIEKSNDIFGRQHPKDVLAEAVSVE
ncbi:hypothetical protein HYALB_00013907 [Hymenoscyphus albidus]|uniref:Uncharacterized protein n=1 Tax=Hymenoscyphus albidus TaxID=595503 RepID=A0A9N9M0G3_9HELO|nr:hypothetical protein HYALB_00013907 [Hymenoscyphus albidus]